MALKTPTETMTHPSKKLRHGGRLAEAAERWNIPRERWLDLSTGINPLGWPLPDIPESAWRRLPDEDDGLKSVIRQWGGAPDNAGCAAVPGTQAAIQALPRLRAPCRVGIPVPAYEEHGRCWAAAGHEIVPIKVASTDDDWIDELDVLVWINPNNPTGHERSRHQLQQWHHRLNARGGWLIIDEAFLLPDDEGRSLAAVSPEAGLIVLKSLGKFFGLAGVRAGAVIGDPAITTELEDHLGPWAMSGPARFLMRKALVDSRWQIDATRQIRRSSARFSALLGSHHLPAPSGTPLFRYVLTENARAIADGLAREAILVRRFANPAALRFGLPGDESQWQRLDNALARLAKQFCHAGDAL